MHPGSSNISPAFNCPTGNCTYPFHSSLATNFTCRNAIYNVTHKCGNLEEGCNSTLNLDASDAGALIQLSFGSLEVIDGDELNGTENNSTADWDSVSLGLWNVMDVYMLDTEPTEATIGRFGLIYYTFAPCTQGWLDNNFTGTQQPNDCISSVNAYGSNVIENVNELSNLTWPNIGASICEIDWCITDFNSSVSYNAISENATTNPAFIASDLLDAYGLVDPGTLIFITNPCYIDGKPFSLNQITSNYTNEAGFVTVWYGDSESLTSLVVPQDCVFTISMDVLTESSGLPFVNDGEGYSNISGSMLTGIGFLPAGSLGVLNDNESPVEFQPTWLQPFFNGAYANFETINATVAGLSSALTQWTRAHGNNTNITGTSFTNQSCVYVSWKWLTLPATLIMLTCAFLSVVIVQSRRLGVARNWKSSVYPAILSELDDETKIRIQTGLIMDDVFAVTEGIKVSLVDWGNGLKLKQE